MFHHALLTSRIAARPHKPVWVQPVLAPSAKIVEQVREHFAARAGAEARLDCPATRDWLAKREA